jgi:hypothetical protein
MGTSSLTGHFRQLDVVAKHLGWCPSFRFRRLLTMFARSVGPSNVEDLFALATLLAYEHLHPILTAGPTAEEDERVRAYLDGHQDEFERGIIRELDRERKGWNRTARRSVTSAERVLEVPATDSWHQGAERIEQEEWLRRTIETTLPPEDQELFRLRFGHQLSFMQIATFPGFEGQSLVAIRKRWSRLCEQLRDVLKDSTG